MVRVLQWITSLVLFCLLLGLALILLAPRMWELDLRAVASGSMAPNIPMGSMVVIQPVEIEAILPGDIITFKSPELPDNVVTHRVVAVTVMGGERAFRTQGDANQDADLELIPASKVLGRVLFALPYFGYLSNFIRMRQGWFLMIILPAGILIILELVNILKWIWSNDKGLSRGARSTKSPVEAETSEYGSHELGDVP